MTLTTRHRAYEGTMTGVLWAYLTVPAALTFVPDMNVLSLFLIFSLLVLISPLLVALVGPGAFLLSWIHTVQMECWARQVRTHRQIRTIGVLLGMPLGVANLLLCLWSLSWLRTAPVESFTLTRELLILMIPAIAGGAGLGWGVTTDLVPHRRVA
jgi:hypothetical protein